MRFTKVSGTTALAVLVGMTGGVGLAGTARADAPGPVSLPSYSHLVVDAAHRHLFLSGGPGSAAILVTDFDGARVGTVPGEPGATALALSPDGATLYAALPGADAVSAVDTATLTETARYTTGAGADQDPRSLAVAGGRIWFGYGSGGRGGIGSIDPGTAPATVTLHTGGWYGAPYLAASPYAPGRLLAGETYASPAEIRVYDVSSGSPVQSAEVSDGGGTVRELAVTPDGEDVVVASGSPYYHRVLRLADLSPDGTYPTDAYPNAVAIAPDGTVAAGTFEDGPDVYVFPAGAATPRHVFDVSGEGGDITLADASLAWAPDGSRLFAVSTDLDGGRAALHILTDPEKAGTELTATGSQSGIPGQPLTVRGTLSSGEPFATAPSLRVVRADPAHPTGVALPDAAVAADGSYSFTDRPPAKAAYTYTVTYAGDATHSATSASSQAIVAPAATLLLVSGPAKATRGAALTLTGTLTTAVPDGPSKPLAGAIVHLKRKDASGTAALPDVRTAANGTYTLKDTPQVGGPVTYAAAYSGDLAHAASSASTGVQVSRAAAKVTVTTNAATYAYGATAKVTAHLGTTHNGRTVSLYALAYGGAKTLVKTGKVDSHGNLAASYRVTRGTTFTVSFPGDFRYAPASASRGVRAYARVTESLRGYYTSAKIGATTYRIYHHTTDPVTGATVAPAKHNECVAFTAQVLTGGTWRTIATASCIRTGADSAAWATLTGTHPLAYHYRFRAQYVHAAADPANLNTFGPWTYFLFRK